MSIILMFVISHLVGLSKSPDTAWQFKLASLLRTRKNISGIPFLLLDKSK